MLKFIIRLDDACPTMNENKWLRIEKLLDKYDIKPIVGIIPDNKDLEFNNEIIENFWSKYPQNWQKKEWIIAQHGLNHNLSKIVRTEFKGKTYKKQKEIIKKGYNIMMKNLVTPTCFFAPAHTFDKNTIKVCSDLNYFDFISDGYAFFPYKYKKMLFIPSVFDTPHKISKKGVFTFVYHPNNMIDADYDYLEKFIIKYKDNFSTNIHEIQEKYKNRKKNIFDYFLHWAIILFRKVRLVLNKNEK